MSDVGEQVTADTSASAVSGTAEGAATDAAVSDPASDGCAAEPSEGTETVADVETNKVTSEEALLAKRLRMIDVFLKCIVATAVIQLLYCALAGTTFPLNSLLAGVGSCVATFVLTVSLRMQVAGKTIRAQRAYAEYLFANILVQFAVLNFMG